MFCKLEIRNVTIDVFEYSIGILRIDFEKPFYISTRRDLDEEDYLIKNHFGLTSLECKNGERIESIPNDYDLPLLPLHLIPLPQVDDSESLSYLLAIMADAYEDLRITNQYTSMVILSLTHINDPFLNEGDSIISRNLNSCHLRFLTESEQKLPGSQKKRYVTPLGDAIFGNYEIILQENDYQFDSFIQEHAAVQVLTTSKSLLEPLHSNIFENLTDYKEEFTNFVTAKCVPLPDQINSDGDINFISITTNGGFPGLDKILKPLLKPILDPITSVLGAIIGSTMGIALRGLLGQELDNALDAHITPRLTTSLIPHLATTMVPPLIETLGTTVTYSLARTLSDNISNNITKILTPALTESVTRVVVPLLTKQISAESSLKIAKHTTQSITHMLARSIPHALVPALSNTITHSPMSDYFCYYCYQHGVYCDYCQSSPAQTFYSTYYTGYYSQYYGDYYASSFANMVQD